MSTEICNLCEHIAANTDSEAVVNYGLRWVCGRMEGKLRTLDTKKDRAHIYVLTPSDCPLKKSKTPNYYGTFLEEEA